MRLVSFYAWFRSWFRSALHAAARIPAPDPYCAAAPGSLPRPFSRRIRHRTLPARPVLFFRQNLVAFEVGHATFDNHIGFKVQYTFDMRSGISSSRPIRDGRDFRNQMCAVGHASSMWPMRSRRTLVWVTSTPHFSQITPRCFRRLYLPHRHS